MGIEHQSKRVSNHPLISGGSARQPRAIASAVVQKRVIYRRRGDSAARAMNFVAVSQVDECRRRHHLVSLDSINIVLDMHRYEAPLLAVIIGQLFEVGSKRTARLAPSSPEIEHNPAIFGLENLIEREKTFNLVDVHQLS